MVSKPQSEAALDYSTSLSSAVFQTGFPAPDQSVPPLHRSVFCPNVCSLPGSRLPDYPTSDLFSSWIMEEWITCPVGVVTRIWLCWGLLSLLAAFWPVVYSWKRIFSYKVFFFWFHLCLFSSLNTNKWGVIDYILRGEIFELWSVVNPDWSDMALCVEGRSQNGKKNTHLPPLVFLFS